jgi:N-acylneuraminate cytidylyltransferase
MVTLAVIPARGGSTRIPGKNKRLLNGKPLVAWTIEAALKALTIDVVLVSSDDPEIIALAREFGAQCLGPRERLSDGFAAASEVTLYEAERFTELTGEEPQVLVQLLPTCPFRSAVSIDLFVESHLETGLTLISASQAVGANLWWAATVDDAGRPNMLHADAFGLRSQDLPPLLTPSGAVWVGSYLTVKEANSFYTSDYRLKEISWREAFDIDTLEEFDLAESLAGGID